MTASLKPWYQAVLVILAVMIATCAVGLTWPAALFPILVFVLIGAGLGTIGVRR